MGLGTTAGSVKTDSEKRNTSMFTCRHVTLAVIIGAILTATGITQTMPGSIRPGRGGMMRRSEAPGSVEATNNIQKFPDTCEIPQQQTFPSELKYFQSFHPADSPFDFWCKVQTLNGSGTFTAEIGENNSYMFIHKEPFNFTGTPQSTRRYLAKVLTEAIQVHISGDRSRTVITPMSVFGFPAKSVEGQRAIYQRQLKLTFEGIEVSGVPFSVIGFFDVTQKATAKWLTGVETPLEFAARFRTGMIGGETVVALPVAFRALMLYSDDPKLQYSISDILATVKTKYGKFQTKQGQAADTLLAGPGVYTDKSNSVAVEEGDSRGRRFLKISYAPNGNGPLDPTEGDELAKLAKAAADREAAKDKAEVDSKKTKNPL